ncbi:hypothetical protein EJ06DRAFT_544342 [Trichodelitschia bisporula]|uniref:Trichothecene 3-O-acetyltransferase-like N-terminal domain-containing protein n=1 Tax=Trichodelitschia bisporula TaxID=703511 RepID=A0A6G1HP51_9PEZI|nr:hypothetical protein EJ06DRAFT_544342 [Trichodelitschia bisporula]
MSPNNCHPPLTGHVVNEDASPRNSGIFKIRPLSQIPLTFRDLTSELIIDGLKNAQFPIHTLDESMIAPRRTLQGLPGDDPILPVFLVQLNFITGGIILTGTAFTDEELELRNTDRRKIISIGDGPISNEQKVQSAPPAQAADCGWADFTFPASALATLKDAASQAKSLPSATSPTFQTVMRARAHRIEPNAVCLVARPMNARALFGIPPAYMGTAQNMTYTRMSVQQLAGPISNVATSLLAALDLIDLKKQTAALAAVFTRSPDKSSISMTAAVDWTRDIILSSWAKFNYYICDFGFRLGLPIAVRRPHFTPVEGLMYILPQTPRGDLTVVLCLRDEDIKHLLVDPELIKFTQPPHLAEF